jgi:hypothetical protein
LTDRLMHRPPRPAIVTADADADDGMDRLLTLAIAENNVSPAHNPGHLTEAA